MTKTETPGWGAEREVELKARSGYRRRDLRRLAILFGLVGVTIYGMGWWMAYVSWWEGIVEPGSILLLHLLLVGVYVGMRLYERCLNPLVGTQNRTKRPR
jgi:hypothetical protein